jgi:ATP-dependent DNA helicase DinG
MLAKVLVWLNEGGSGDRNEINLNGPVERECGCAFQLKMKAARLKPAWTRSSGGCPFYNARQAAQSAHVVIVNHALLLADVASGNRVLPEYNFPDHR